MKHYSAFLYETQHNKWCKIIDVHKYDLFKFLLETLFEDYEEEELFDSEEESDTFYNTSVTKIIDTLIDLKKIITNDELTYGILILDDRNRPIAQI